MASVSLLPAYTNVERVSQQAENQVFLETSACKYQEMIPFSLSAGPARQVTYRKRTFGILNLKLHYRFTSNEDIEVYAAATPQGGSREVVLAKLRLSEGHLTLWGNKTYIPEDETYTRIPSKTT